MPINPNANAIIVRLLNSGIAGVGVVVSVEDAVGVDVGFIVGSIVGVMLGSGVGNSGTSPFEKDHPGPTVKFCAETTEQKLKSRIKKTVIRAVLFFKFLLHTPMISIY